MFVKMFVTLYGSWVIMQHYGKMVNPLIGTDNYSATSNNIQLVHCPLMGGLLLLVQRGQAPPRCTQSPPINSQCTNHSIAV